MRKVYVISGLLLLLIAAIFSGCTAPPTLTLAPTAAEEDAAPPEETPPPAASSDSEDSSENMADSPLGAAAKAVDLIGYWVEAGAPETGSFEYTGVDGNSYEGMYDVDIQPLFTENNLWFEGQQACTGCHFANTENSYHEMDLSNYSGIMSGGDVLSEPPGVPLFGQSEVGASDFDWDHSKMRARLRNNRMPPGWEFDITEENRDGLCVEVSADGVTVMPGEYGCELNGLGVISTWVESGAPETDSFEYGGAQLTFERDVQPFFTQPNMWYEGSQACTGCHFANSENSYHEMDLGTYAGIMSGGDVLSEPPGVPLLGQSEVGATDFDWEHSKLKERLRNNRMAPGVPFDITEENRDGPLVLHGEAVETEGTAELFGSGQCEVKTVDLIGYWVEGGAPESGAFDFTADDGSSCEGTFEADILQLFTENNLWFEGQQACIGCHFANTENSYHEMDLGTYAGIMSGGDVLSEPPGVPLFGQSEVGASDFDWDHSKMRARLRNNRMPPGWEFDITEENRDGLCVEVSADGITVLPGEYGCELNGLGVISTWVISGAPELDAFEYGGAQLTFERDVLPFFTENNMWYEGSQACIGCHFANTENSYHEMDLGTYAGIMSGGDVLSEPPGVPLLGQSEVGATDFDWEHSKLKERLRNNRMAPGVPFDITEENRDGPMILAGVKK